MEYVTALLHANNREWRPVVVGSWFSIKFDFESMGEELLESIGLSLGYLTSQPLAVSCVLVAGENARNQLTECLDGYLGRDSSAGFLGAALEYLSGSPGFEVNSKERRDFHELLAVGERLRAELT